MLSILSCLDWLMPPKKQRQAQVISIPKQNPLGSSEVHSLIIQTALAIRIPPDQSILRNHQVAVVNICNEEFTLLYSFIKQHGRVSHKNLVKPGRTSTSNLFVNGLLTCSLCQRVQVVATFTARLGPFSCSGQC